MSEKAMSLTDPGYQLAQVLSVPQGPEATIGETMINFPADQDHPETAFLIRHLTPPITEEGTVRSANVYFVGHSAVGEEIVGSFSATGKPLVETMRYSRFQPDVDITSSAQ